MEIKVPGVGYPLPIVLDNYKYIRLIQFVEQTPASFFGKVCRTAIDLRIPTRYLLCALLGHQEESLTIFIRGDQQINQIDILRGLFVGWLKIFSDPEMTPCKDGSMWDFPEPRASIAWDQHGITSCEFRSELIRTPGHFALHVSRFERCSNVFQLDFKPSSCFLQDIFRCNRRPPVCLYVGRRL